MIEKLSKRTFPKVFKLWNTVRQAPESVQIQTEEFMTASMMEIFHRNFRERDAGRKKRPTDSGNSSKCGVESKNSLRFLESEAKRHTKEVAEQSAKRIGGKFLASLTYSSYTARNKLLATHSRFITDWLREIDVAASMGEWDHSGFVVRRTPNGVWEILDSEIAKGIMRIIPTGFKRNMERLSTKASVQCLQGMICINKTQGHTVNVNAWLNVELHNDNLKMFYQAWRRTLLALVMIWMKVSSRICTKGKWESRHPWRTLYRRTSLTLSWKRSREATRNWGPCLTTSSSIVINHRSCWFRRRSGQERHSSKRVEEKD